LSMILGDNYLTANGSADQWQRDQTGLIVVDSTKGTLVVTNTW